jgi:hypothetical protein
VKRKLTILGIALGTALVAMLVILAIPATRPSVFFSAAEAQTIESPPPTRKVTFYATNTASRPVFLQVAAIETNSGPTWIADTQALPAQTFRTLGRVKASETARLSVVLPLGPGRSRLRVLVSPDATILQKTQFAVRRLWANLRGQGNHRQLWVDKLAIAAYEVVTPEIP